MENRGTYNRSEHGGMQCAVFTAVIHLLDTNSCTHSVADILRSFLTFFFIQIQSSMHIAAVHKVDVLLIRHVELHCGDSSWPYCPCETSIDSVFQPFGFALLM